MTSRPRHPVLLYQFDGDPDDAVRDTVRSLVEGNRSGVCATVDERLSTQPPGQSGTRIQREAAQRLLDENPEVQLVLAGAVASGRLKLYWYPRESLGSRGSANLDVSPHRLPKPVANITWLLPAATRKEEEQPGPQPRGPVYELEGLLKKGEVIRRAIAEWLLMEEGEKLTAESIVERWSKSDPIDLLDASRHLRRSMVSGGMDWDHAIRDALDILSVLVPLHPRVNGAQGLVHAECCEARRVRRPIELEAYATSFEAARAIVVPTKDAPGLGSAKIEKLFLRELMEKRPFRGMSEDRVAEELRRQERVYKQERIRRERFGDTMDGLEPPYFLFLRDAFEESDALVDELRKNISVYRDGKERDPFASAFEEAVRRIKRIDVETAASAAESSHHSAEETSMSTEIFISYSRRDANWLVRIKTMLAPVLRQPDIRGWDDTVIKPGENWRSEIEAALKRAKVAVLLVSDAFLASDFIAQNELPPLLAAAESRGLKILWVPINRCLYKETPIGQYQALWDPGSPLIKLETEESALNEAVAVICEKIADACRAG